MNKKIILTRLLKDFYPFAKKQLGFNKPVSLFLVANQENANNPLGKTAYYEPEKNKISLLYVNRHPKDILRSFAHELVHHKQNCDGQLYHTTNNIDEDGNLFDLELDANAGGIVLRMWERELEKQGKSKYYEDLMRAEGEFLQEQDVNPWAICSKSVGQPKKKNKKGEKSKYERCVLKIKKKHDIKKENIEERWSKEYKDSIDCSNPKGFSQRAHCQGRKKNKIMKENKDYERSLDDTTENDTVKDHFNKRAERLFDKLTERWKEKKTSEENSNDK